MMPIHIKNISLRGLGPIESLSLDLGQVNLIYGHNETGKTFLVEFLLQSLFRQSGDWQIRKAAGQGSVSVQGLEENLVSLDPSSPKKIEDYWEEEDLGLPLNMARLLVVKGGELALSAGVPGGINRAVLKAVLTRETLLEEIRSNIQNTVQKATIDEGIIAGENRGLLKQRSDALQGQSRISALLKEFESDYSRGPIRTLELKIEESTAALERQLDARRYRAYQISQDKLMLENTRNALPGALLQSLGEKLTQYQLLADENDLLHKKMDQNLSRSSEYAWLKEALTIWENLQLDASNKPSPYLILAGLIPLVISLALPQIPSTWKGFLADWMSVPFAVIGLGLVSYYIYRLQAWSDSSPRNEERREIQREFQEKFNQPLRNLAGLKEKYSSQQEFSILAANQKRELEELSVRSQGLSGEISRLLLDLLDQKIPPEDWHTALRDLQNKKTDLENAIHVLDKELAVLGLEENEYRSEPSPENYQPGRLAEIQNTMDRLSSELADQQSSLATLKKNACRETGADLAAPWQEVFNLLREFKRSMDATCLELEAKIKAGIGLTEIINRVEAQEDQKIQRDLNTPEVSDLLTALTGSYSKLELVEDRIFVSDPFSRYPLEDVSTGAREQIQLAIRMGLASRISGGEPLFMILDDAFQHSDWGRREALVEQVITLSKKGWQVTYLSMDDHIRDLFKNLGEKYLKRNFKYFEIN
jgi:hypothetical protein